MTLVGVLGKGVLLSACHQGTPSWGVGESPSHILLNHACPLHTVRDCFPLSPGLVLGKESAAHILSRKGGGNLLSIVVGGIQEALTARPGAYKLVLQNCKGFIRLALIHGYREEGSEFSWILARIVFWREDCRGKCRFYFGKESLNPLTMKSLSW